MGRRIHEETGRIYHLRYDPPPPGLEGKLVQRKDDTEEAIRKRLDYYHQWTTPILPIYEQKGLLRRVDGVGTPDEVTKRITAVLGK